MTRVVVALIVVGAGVLSSQAYAHHSFPATYQDRLVTIQGEITQIVLRNPHSFMQVLVTETDGAMVRYAVEWNGARELVSQGVTRDTLKPGDYVVISGAPGRDPAGRRVRVFSLRRPKDGFGWAMPPGEMKN
jgi:YD repeat-containing protein